MKIALVLALLLACPATLLSQSTWYVPDDFGTIQEAVNNAANGSTIIVRPAVRTRNSRARSFLPG